MFLMFLLVAGTPRQAATHIDAISAKESVTKNMPKATTASIQIPPAEPPFKRAMPMPLQKTHVSDRCRFGVDSIHQCVFPSAAKHNGKAKDGHKFKSSLGYREHMKTSSGSLSEHTVSTGSLPIRSMSFLSLRVPAFANWILSS
jgi:hypothetical protein